VVDRATADLEAVLYPARRRTRPAAPGWSPASRRPAGDRLPRPEGVPDCHLRRSRGNLGEDGYIALADPERDVAALGDEVLAAMRQGLLDAVKFAR